VLPLHPIAFQDGGATCGDCITAARSQEQQKRCLSDEVASAMMAREASNRMLAIMCWPRIFSQTGVSMQPTSGQMPTGAPSLAPIPTKAPRRSRRLISILTTIGVLAVLGIGIYVHSLGATSTLQTFYNDFFSYKFDAAFALICSDKQSAIAPSFNAAKTEFQAFEGKVTFDTSKLQYDVASSGLTDTTVHLHGSVTANGAGSQSVTVDETDDMQASGLGWCVNADKFGGS
jgi:hypothetical protein